MICFGPIPSRRLGKSLGINNIPNKKVCSYSCTYCQIGAKQRHSYQREIFYSTEQIVEATLNHLQKLSVNDKPDYLTFVANGEPTLDKNLGKSIKALKSLGYPVAVITNGSMLFDSEVQNELMQADWVSIKIDTAEQSVWSSLNRPHPKLNFDILSEGIICFAQQYSGILVTETMLVDGVNDEGFSLVRTAHQVFRVNPSQAYISIPTRPPAILTVKAASEHNINKAYQIFTRQGLNTQLMLGFEGTQMGISGNAVDDILSICAVHPIREDSMRELLTKNHAEWKILKMLIDEGRVVETEYDEMKFYIRKR